MADESPEHSEALGTMPLSVSFRDTAFMRFVNELSTHGNSTPHNSRDRTPRARVPNAPNAPSSRQNPQSAERQTTPKHLQAPISTASATRATPNQARNVLGQSSSVPRGSADRQRHRNQQESALLSNVISIETTDDNDDGDEWDELDNMELDSQTMRQLEETEEKFYATQQSMIHDAPLLSQELSGAGSQLAKHAVVDPDARNSRAVPGAKSRSVPVTPTFPRPSHSPSSNLGLRSGIESDAKADSRQPPPPGHPLSTQRQTTNQQQYQRGKQYTHAQQPNAPRSRVNLYPRLAQHIPQAPISSNSNSSSSWTQRPPPGSHSKPAQAHASQSSYRNNVPFQQQQRQRQYQRQQAFSQSTSTATQLELNTSTLVSSGTLHSQALQPHAQIDIAQVLEELANIRAENDRIRAESDQLKSQLYTKEGEVKIVRENLARTEIENTHLQEQLANQISTTALAQKQAEQRLQVEIDRLKTELFFHEQEAQIASISKTPSARSTTGTAVGTRAASQAAGSEVAAAGHQNSSGSGVVPYTSTGHSASMPKRLTRSVATDTRADSSPSSGQGHGQANGGDASTTAHAALLAILTDISKPPSSGFGDTVSLSIRLSEAVQTNSAEHIAEFHRQACSIMRQAAEDCSYGQLGSAAQLLARAVDGLAEFRAQWLLDATPVLDSSGEQDAVSAAGGYLRTSQLAAAIGSALQKILTAKLASQADNSSKACGTCIFSLCKLFTNLVAIQPVAALDSSVWRGLNPCSLGQFLTHGFSLEGLLGLLELITTLVQVSDVSWSYVRNDPGSFELLLLAIMKRLHAADSEGEQQMLDGERNLLVLIASAIVTHEEDTSRLINAMPKFTRVMIQAFLNEHAVLSSQYPYVGSKRRVQVFFEYVKCLHVVLSEVQDVVALLDGDSSPAFFAFVTACTRMAIGESVFSEFASVRDLAADLLAYVVTEDQALAIHSL